MELTALNRNRILITADDFGMSPRANRNTRHLIGLGKIDRVAIMPLGEISPEEISELLRSGVKLDIHLDILYEFGKDRTKRVGTLKRILEFVRKIINGNLSTKKIHDDWQSQIILFHQLFGKYPDGINSHEHVHFFPPFFKVALKLQEQYSIPYMRFGESLRLSHHTTIAFVLYVLRFFDRKSFLKSGCVSSVSLVSLDWIGNMENFFKNLPDGTIEIACHPEKADEFEKIKKYF